MNQHACRLENQSIKLPCWQKLQLDLTMRGNTPQVLYHSESKQTFSEWLCLTSVV